MNVTSVSHSKNQAKPVVVKIDDLKPWMRGPFELIRHANGHLQAKGDTDRRIALIGFDNAIEVSIDVFVRLHPKVRGGLEIKQTEVENAQRNYHTKIEFLDKHVQDRQIPLAIPVAEIVWYHQLRNELYHSGNGMVPEEHVIQGARSAAIAVFSALFNVDLSPLLGDSGVTPSESNAGLVRSPNPEMEFLRWYIELEQAMRKLLPKETERPLPLMRLWQTIAKTRPNLRKLNSAFIDLTKVRNDIVHGASSPVPESELNRHMEAILEIIEQLQP